MVIHGVVIRWSLPGKEDVLWWEEARCLKLLKAGSGLAQQEEERDAEEHCRGPVRSGLEVCEKDVGIRP